MLQIIRHSLARHLAIVATASLALSVAACDDDDEPTGPASAAGTYNLTTIEQEGFAACTIGASGCTLNDTGTDVIVVEDATLVLSANGTFTFSANGTLNGVDEEITGAAGTWTRTQTGVTLTIPGEPSVTATFTSAAEDELEAVITGDVLGSTVPTITLTFDRQ